MANTKSAEKRNRQAQKRRARNQAVKTQVRGSIKEVRDAIAKEPAKAAEIVRAAERSIAKAATKGVLHKRNASRRIARLHKAVAAATKK
ncbi:MAG: 30S ribosomal protein S20 [Deltaproteobacteria bacterium]|nr:30S ribosomal protein S20 [Deltaproteobacteria bacterium]